MKARYNLFRTIKEGLQKAGRFQSGAKGSGKKGNSSEKDQNHQALPGKKTPDKKLIAAAAALCAAAVCFCVPSVTRRLTQRDDSVHVLPVTLAGAGTERTDDAFSSEKGVYDKEERLRHQTGMLLKAAVMDIQTAQTCALSEPVDTSRENTIESALSIGYKSIKTVTENQIMSYTDYATLLQIVEAECTGGDERSKLLVANVILNRVEDEHFPDNIYEVVWQRVDGQAQFSPTQDGRMGTLNISDTTISAVKRAVEGENISEGALFFLARKYSSKRNVDWFDSELVYLYSYGGHDFYKFKDEVEETEENWDDSSAA